MAKGVYKRGNVYWIRYAGQDGKIVFESSGSSKFRDAEGLLLKRRQSVKEGTLPETRSMSNYSLNDLAQKYIAWMQGRHRSEDTKKYRINQILTYFGNPLLRNFNTLIAEQYQTELMKKGLKPASINKNIGILKAMFTKAVEWNLVEERTLKSIRKVKQMTENNKRLRFLSKEECEDLINACDNHLKPIVITAIHTGMRRGEILSLTWDQIDFTSGFIYLEVTKNGERREIPIDRKLKETLGNIIRRLDVPYVFYDTKTGKPFKEVKRSYSSAVTKAKLKDFHFHDLRHTFASLLVMDGVSIPTLMKLLGHKSMTMTMRYANLSQAHKAKAVEALDRIFSDNFGTQTGITSFP